MQINRAATYTLLLAIAFTLSACQQTASIPEPDVVEETGERLLATPPPNWHRIYNVNARATRIVDYVKAEENADDWETKLSFESFAAHDIEADPITLLMSEAQADMSRCNFVQHYNVYSGYENNYETSVRLFLCGENAFTGKGEVKLVKVIRGNAYYYSVRITRKVPVFEVDNPQFTNEQIANWSNYLKTVSVCDDTAGHPCPAPAPDTTSE